MAAVFLHFTSKSSVQRSAEKTLLFLQTRLFFSAGESDADVTHLLVFSSLYTKAQGDVTTINRIMLPENRKRRIQREDLLQFSFSVLKYPPTPSKEQPIGERSHSAGFSLEFWVLVLQFFWMSA